MRAVILTAGRGERMQPLSFEKQKHLIRVLGKTILEHDLDQLNGPIKEVILVIRDDEKCREIKKLIGNRYKELKIKYAIQKKPLGTADAAKSALPFLKDRFLLLYGDDLYFKDDIKKVLKRFPCLLARQVKSPQFFGIVTHKRGIITSFIEKPQRPKSNLANTGLYFLPKEIFNYSIKKSPRGEYEFTDYIKKFIKNHKVYVTEAEHWVPISFCWNLLAANQLLLKKVRDGRAGKIEKGCKISGKLIVGKGTVIKAGSCIEGPVYIGENCFVGPNCFLRKFICLGDDCRIEQGVTIENSVIGKETEIEHNSFISNSVIGEGCKIGAGTTTISFQKSGRTIKTKVNGKIIDTKRVKFGTVLGDKVKTGPGTVILPGKKIWPRKTTYAGQKVQEDINNN